MPPPQEIGLDACMEQRKYVAGSLYSQAGHPTLFHLDMTCPDRGYIVKRKRWFGLEHCQITALQNNWHCI
jgi:hypothetical protein